MKKTYKNSRLPNWTAKEAAGGFHIYQGKGFESLVPAELIIGSPDWVEEKDFVITAFRDGGEIYKLVNFKLNFPYQARGGAMALSYDYAISSGKEIFSVLCNGIEWKLQDKSEQGEIAKFWIDGDEMNVSVKFIIGKTGCISVTNDYNISSITPAKKVILTTEDGVELVSGDWAIYVNPSIEIAGERLVNEENFKTVISQCVKGGGKYFSTREAAESYISQNKKKYSENDIRDILIKNFNKELVQSLITKLNEKK